MAKPTPRPKLLTLEDLSEKQASFVLEYVARGGMPGTGKDAVLASKFECTTDASAKTTAHRLLHDPRIIEVIKNLAAAAGNVAAVASMEVLVKMVTEGDFHGQKVKPETALKAAESLLNRAGLSAIARSEVNVNVTDHRSEKELVEHIANLRRQLGIEAPVKTLEAIDVEATEVDPAAPHGRTKDGVPRNKSGPKPYKRRLEPPKPGEVDYTGMNAAQRKRSAERHKQRTLLAQARASLKAKRQQQESENV